MEHNIASSLLPVQKEFSIAALILHDLKNTITLGNLGTLLFLAGPSFKECSGLFAEFPSKLRVNDEISILVIKAGPQLEKGLKR